MVYIKQGRHGQSTGLQSSYSSMLLHVENESRESMDCTVAAMQTTFSDTLRGIIVEYFSQESKGCTKNMPGTYYNKRVLYVQVPGTCEYEYVRCKKLQSCA